MKKHTKKQISRKKLIKKKQTSRKKQKYNKSKSQFKNKVKVMIKNMNGGATQITGYVGMLDFLYSFKENLNKVKSPVNIVSFIDSENSNDPEQIGDIVLYVWRRQNIYIQDSQNQNIKEQTMDGAIVYTDFDEFTKAVIDFLKNVENDLSSPEKQFLDVKRQRLYSLVTQNGDFDVDIVV